MRGIKSGPAGRIDDSGITGTKNNNKQKGSKMARLRGPVLGNVSGAVGNIVFQEKGDSSILYKKATKKEIVMTDKRFAIQEKFRLVAKLALGINASAELKKQWPASSKNRHSRFNSIFQTNYPLVHTVEDLGKPIMIPNPGFPLKNGVITTTLTGITFSCDAPGMDSGVNTNLEKFGSAVGIMVLRSPVNEEDPSFRVLNVGTGKQALDVDAPINLVCNYVGDQLTMFEGYTDKKVFLVFVTTDTSGNPIHYSVQFSH